MKTVIEQVAENLSQFKNIAEIFFLNHSGIRNCGRGMIGISQYEWCDLNPQGKQLQAQLYKKYCYLAEIMGVLISELPPEYQRTFKDCKNELLSYIEQDTQIWVSSISIVFDKVNGLLDKQFELLRNVCSENDGAHIFVPDTNALLTNPYLDKWKFNEIDHFEILLTPSVLSELDLLKTTGRNDEVRNKAHSIIRSIKEYRRRGKLTEGVTLKKNISTIRSIAIEPDFKMTFSWLKEHNKDDQLLASFVEIMKQHPKSIVFLVTLDINLQNKAEYAGLPFIEPPTLE